MQNYPNPFNPSTTISYILNEPGYVKLKIFDALGKNIITLVDEFKQSGNYKIEWSADNEASGTYFIQLNVNGKLMTQKMMLLK
ncbi:MAG: T9SS type A sorting domain-containing protein [bacterium]|nr:T9SS type A sorting domain-containing protein [bacterium]